MLVGVTRTQFQAAIVPFAASTAYYTLVLGNVITAALASPSGWLAFVIVGVYSEANFLSDTTGYTAVAVASISV